MKDACRLFDCLTHFPDHAPLPDMLAAKEQGAWRSYSSQEITDTVIRLSAGLLQAGISGRDMDPEHRDKIAIICNNRPEWVMLDLAVQRCGAVLVPIYPTIHLTELAFILKDAAVKMVFVQDAELFRQVQYLQAQLPTLETIYSFDPVTDAPHWSQLPERADAASITRAAAIANSIREEDLATILYTSGTTGTPKGVMLSHGNILSNIKACLPLIPPFTHRPRALSFLPLNHIFERMMTYLYLFQGIPVYYAENLDAIGENLREVCPDAFTTVPRLLEKVYERIMEKGAQLTGPKKRLFYWAHDLACRYEINQPQALSYRLQLALANRLVFSKWRQALGNNIKGIIIGGAACQVRLIRLFTAARIPILEGYGLTETSPVISVNRYEVTDRMFGTVGPLLDGIEIRIAEDGEILCKGPNVMMGYYKRPDLTADTIRDGWCHTGDIGELIAGKYLKITDRKKEIFKTSGGKYVAPLPVENKLKESLFIEHAMVLGADRKYTAALIVPAFSPLRAWATRHGIPFSSNETLIHHPRVIELYTGIVTGFNQYFSSPERVKKFTLLADEWNVANGELTPKLSLRRKVILEKYGEAVEGMYAP
ncbi:long-chain fatty acid--CoA ligase [Chitinophaga agrisoli]|uniref:Long-chain fatty acid--CoA ligase n=1 Tax=Chitinophaga agrisoli TaxID=2607653 RepID=A0A5B2VJP1_9BACT|nr:long-chain fatty acid--CoA ligase [Chitinophaga agrisoli]KAA2238766.1 long-chain fatty acid--CoA ligase [Chitinophaga agrisoli]